MAKGIIGGEEKNNFFKDWSIAIKGLDLKKDKSEQIVWRKIKPDTIVSGETYCINENNIPSLWNNFNGNSMLAKGYTHYIYVSELLKLPKEE